MEKRTARTTRGPDNKIKGLLYKIENELAGSIEPISIVELNSFERKLIHRHFDRNPAVVTKTYRKDDDYELRVYPVGNLKKFAIQKADEVVQTGKKAVLPHMGSFERYVVHNALKEIDSVKSKSYGDGENRHIEIEAAIFGRGLRRIIKKIKLL
jgi:predicted RNA-binding protein Jag